MKTPAQKLTEETVSCTPRSQSPRKKKGALIAHKLITEGQSYIVKDTFRLPEILRPDKAAVRHTNWCVMFYRRSAVYSNFHPSRVSIDHIGYNHVGKELQHKGALHANDTAAVTNILAASDAHRSELPW